MKVKVNDLITYLRKCDGNAEVFINIRQKNGSSLLVEAEKDSILDLKERVVIGGKDDGRVGLEWFGL